MPSNPRLSNEKRREIEDQILRLSGLNNADGRNTSKIRFLRRQLGDDTVARARDALKGRHEKRSR